jgi:filamentous hemagglutinin family protein
MQQRGSGRSRGERGLTGTGGYAYHALSAALLSAIAAGAQAEGTRITTDGRTATSVTTDGASTRVTTDTVRGEHAFNSFRHFRVGKGHEANLQLPDGTANLINLVHDSRAVVDGTLNSFKAGKIGGNVVFADPHGFIVGASGTVNVGTLGVATPRAAFMDRVISPAGEIGAGAVDELLDGDFDVAPDAVIRIDGRVNAEESVRLLAGEVMIGGTVDVSDPGASDADAEALFNEAVNTDGLARADSLAAGSGGIVVAAEGDADIDGDLTADGAVDGGQGGTIVVTAGDTVALGDDASVDVSGTGQDADGGTALIWGDERAEVAAGARFDAEAGETGDGGLVEVSAREHVQLDALSADLSGGGDGEAGTFVVDPETVTAGSTEYYTDGGNVEIIADDSITVEAGATINTRDIDDSDFANDKTNADAESQDSTGDSGDVLLKAPEITLAGDGTDGASVLSFATGGYDAGAITLQAGEDALSDIDITDEAIIDIQSGAIVDAGARGNGAAGDVTVSALAIDRLASGVGAATADVDVTGDIIGRDIAVNAEARTLIDLETAQSADDVTAAEDITNRIEATINDPGDLTENLDVLPGSFAVAEGDATVDVNDGAALTATRDLDVTADATRLVDIADDGGIGGSAGGTKLELAVMYGQISGTTRAAVADGATVSAGRDLAVEATSDNTLKAAANAVGGGGKKTGAGSTAYGGNNVKIGGALSIGYAGTTTEATLEVDVTVADAVDVAARADNEYASTASFTMAQRKIDGQRVSGLTAAIGDFNSAVDARLGSDIDTAGDVRVTADSETTGNRTAATTGVSARQRTQHVDSNAGASRAAGGAGGKSTAPLDQQSGGNGKGIQLGGAIAIGLTDLSADARIDAGTEVTTDGNVAVQGRVTQSGIRTIAESGLSVKGASENSLLSLATGITVARHEQEARALIGNDALIEADAVGVRADSETPITANFPDDWVAPGDWNSIQDAVDTVQNVGDAASSAGDLGNNLFSSYTTAKAKTPTDLSLTGSVNYFGVDHTTEAWIGQGADVTARGTGGTAPDEWSTALDADTDWQYDHAVDVRARSHTGVVTGAGVMSKLTGDGGSTTAGAGGVFSWVDLDATTSAGIANDAVVDAGEHGIGVDATTDNLVVQVLPAAGKGASIGVAGVFGLTTVNNTTRAAIAESADIDAGSVAVDARQHFGAYGLSGAIMLAENAGVGASAFVHNVETTTEARVDGLGSDEGERIVPDALDDGRAFAAADTITTPDLDINAAADGRLVSIAIAGAVARDKNSQKQGATGSQSTNQQNQSGSANTTTQNQVQGNNSGSGPGANNTLTSSSDRLRQRSEGNTDQEALSGGSRDDRDQQQQQPKFGLAASASGTFNRTRMQTDARLAGATVEGAAGGPDTDVRVRAVNDVDAIAAAGAAALTMGGKGGQKSKFETALAGAAGINWLENDTAAAIDGATVSGAEAVRVQGLTAGDQVAIGLALAISTGGQKNLAISGSGSLNLIRGSTGASVEDAELTAGDADDTTAEVVAYDRSRSLTGGGAFFGASGQGAGFGAAATLGYIANDIDAGIHSSTVTDFATVDVSALTSSQMLLAAVTAGGGTKVAIGGAFYGAYIGNSLSARIDDGGDSGDEASVTGAGDVTVRATGVDAFAELDGVAGGDTPAWLGGADALTDNDQLTQEINPAPDTEESDGLGDSAEAEPMLGGDLSGEMVLGIAGAVQGGANSGSLAFGFSMIDTSYEAVVDGASIEASGNVDVTAANQATIAGVGFGVAAGSKGAFTGSAVANVVRADVEARIGSDRDQSADGGVDLADDEYRATVDAARVNVGASANGAIYAFSGNVAASGSNAGGAAIAYNSIGGDVRARLAAADITTTATATEDDPYAVTVDAARRSAVRAIGAAGQFSGSTTIGGTLVVSDLLGSTAATVDDGSEVDTDALAVRALDGGDELSGLWTLAGNISASGSNSFGGAFSVNTISRTQTAAIDDSTITADGEVKVDSEALANIRTLAVAGGASGSVAASGSLTVNTLIGDEIARVDGSTIDAGGLDIDATGGRSIWSLAGSASASGSTAVGFAGAVNTIRGERAARITGASDINVGGGTVGVESGGATDIVSLAVAGAASGSTAVGGSLAVNTIVRDGVAEVLGGEVTADTLDVDAADSDTRIHALAGSASGSGSTSVGAGITVNTIKGERRALIDGVDLDVAERVDVEAVTGGTIRSAGVAAAVGGTTGVGGAVTTNVLDATVDAGIRDTRSRDNGQDTTVRAKDVAEIDSLGGQVSGGATAGVGASAAVNRIGNSVEAFVEGRHADGDYRVDDLTVSAESRPRIRTAAIGGAGSGEGASVAGSLATNIVTSETRAAIRGGAHVIARDDIALTASDRAVVRVLGGTASFSGRAGVAGTATFNLLEGDTEALIQGASTEVAARGLDPNDNLSVNSGSLAGGAPSPSDWSDPADFNPVEDLDESEKNVNGLAVRASSIQQVGVIGTAVSGTVPRLTGSGSGAGVGNVNVVGGQTRAAIEDATINPAAAGSPHGTADVEVGASSHVFNVGYVFAASGGGWGALAGSLDTNVVQRTTEADIDGAVVNAGDAVRVDADSTQAATSFALGASGAGAALTGTVSLGVIRGETRAAIEGGSDIDSGYGGVTVAADTGIDAVTTGGAAGAGGVAIGASFGIAATEATTEATIAGDTTRVTTPGAVRVDAATDTGLTPASATASFGASTAVAGAASIGVIRNTTEATVDRAAVGANGDRVGSLTVEATDHVTVDTVAGAIGISAQDVGVGAGAGVLVLQSDTRAEILGADVYSAGNVDVSAEREADLFLAATTGGGGAGAGLAGSIGVIVIGDGSVTSDSEDFDSPDSELDAGNDGTLSEISDIVADKDVDASTNHDDPLQTVDEGDDPDNPDATLEKTSGSALDADERASLNNAGAYDPADRYRNRSADQTVAQIDSSTIEAGGTVDVDATNRTATHNVAGALGVGGAVGAGLGIGVTRVYNEVTAAVDNSSVTANAIEVDAVATDLGNGATALVDAYVGAGGGFAGAAVNVADARIDDTVTARVQNTTLTGTGGDAAVRASDTASVSSNAYGAAVAGGVGVTVVYAGAERDGTVDARLDPANTLTGFDDVTLAATSDAPTIARGWAGSGGLLGAGTGTIVIGRDAVNTTSTVAGGADIDVGGTVDIDATARPGVTADALGIALGGYVGVGVSTALATAEPDTEAIIEDGASIDAGALQVDATRGVTTGSTDQGLAGNAIADTFDSGPACNGVSGTDTCAFARGASGGQLLGANATASDADSLGSTTASIGDVTLPGGDVEITAASTTGQYTEATGFSAGIVAVGANLAWARTEVTTRAELDPGVDRHDGSGDLDVTADSSNDATGKAIAGSGGVVSGVASRVDTRDESRTEAVLGGGTGTAPLHVGELTVEAIHDSTYRGSVDSVQASVVGASGARAVHRVTPDVDATVAGGTHLVAESVDIAAETGVDNPRASGYDLTSGSGGVVDAAAVRADSHIAPQTDVVFGAGVDFDIPGDWRDSGNDLVVAANNTFDIDQRIKLDSGGAISVARGESIIDVDGAVAGVDTADARLHTVGDLILAARTEADLDARANVKTYGGAGAAQGESRTTARTTNRVAVGANADFKAWGQMDLQAGRNAIGEEGLLDLTARTDLWNKTAFPVETDPVADAIADQTNTVSIGSGAELRGVRDVTLAADDGRRLLTGSGTGKDLYRKAGEDIANGLGEIVGADEVSLDIKYSNTVDDSTDRVTVDGEVRAGVHAQQTLTIDEDLTASEQSPGITFDVEVRNLAAEVQERLDELYAMLADYDGVEVARDAFEAEISLLERRLKELGGNGDDNAGAPRNVQVQFVEVDPILARPGSIDVTGDALAGGGELRAPGDAVIDINQNGPAFLEITGLEIPADEGGEITFNFTPVASNADINNLNAGGGTAAFGVVETAENSADPLIEVDTTFNPDLQTPPPGVTCEDCNPIDPSIFVTGDIRNLRGTVDMEATTGNVRVTSEIRANTVDIAAGDTLTLSYIDTFRHIGGDPRAGGYGGTLVAGNNVIASARYLNINGTIQSGIADWSLHLDADDRERIENAWYDIKLRDRDNEAGTPAVIYDASENRIELEGVEVQGGYMELSGQIMNTGRGEVWEFDLADVYTDNFPVILNANESQQRIEVGSRWVGSGRSYLYWDGAEGRFELDGAEIENAPDFNGNTSFRTPRGRINVSRAGYDFAANSAVDDADIDPIGELRILDGYGRIDIDNDTGYDLHANALDAGNDVEGTLRINDTSTSADGATTTTVFKRLGGDVVEYRERDNGTLERIETYSDTREASYSPEENLKFAWLTGTDFREERTPRRYTDEAVGFIPSGDGTIDFRDTIELDSAPLEDAEFVTTGDITEGTIDVETEDWKTVSRRNWSTCEASSPGVCWEWRYWSEQVETRGRTEIDRHAIAADNPIEVRFTGQDSPDITVANGDAALTLGGGISAPTGSVDIDAGHIERTGEGAVVSADDIDLDAARGIEAVQVNATGSVRAVTDRGPVEIGSTSALPVERIASDNGAVNIDAGGDVTNAGSGTVIAGSDVTVNSGAGSVGTGTRHITIDSGVGAEGVVNIDAGGDVFITETAGDLRADRIVARGGDLGVVVSGGAIVDANTEQTRDERAREDLLAAWADMALRAQDGADEAVDAQVQAFERRQERIHAIYWQEVRNLTTNGDGDFVADDFDPDTFEYALPDAERQDLLDNGASEDMIAAMEAERETAILRMHEDVLNAPQDASAFNPDFTYTATAADRATFEQGSEWTTEQLENSIAAGLAKGTTDTTTRIEEENFVASGRIDLVADRIGAETAGDVVIDLSGDDISLTDDERVALSSAEPDDLDITDTAITIEQREDVDIDAGGAVTATADSDVFIGGQTEVNVEDVSGGAVRIKTAGDVRTAAPGEVVVDGHRVILESGSGTLGTAADPIRVDVDDRLTARGGNGVHIAQASTLTLQRITSGAEVGVTIDSGDLLAGPDEGIDVIAGGPVTLDVAGDIGGASEALDIDGGPIALDTVGGDAWLAGEQFGGGLVDMELDASDVAGTLDIAGIRALDVIGAVETGSLAVDAGSLGTTIADGQSVNADDGITITGALLDMGAGSSLLGDRVDVDVSGAIDFADIRARGGDAATDLRLVAGGGIQGTDTGARLTNDSGLTRLLAGGSIGASGAPIAVRVDRLHADALDGDLYLTSDRDITFTERSGAMDADGVAATRITARDITGADLIGDTLRVDAANLAGPRIEARSGAMDLNVDGLADIDELIGGAGVTIDAGELRIAQGTVTDALSVTTVARDGLAGNQQLGTVESGGLMTLMADGGLRATDLLSTGSAIDIGAADVVLTRADASTALDVVTSAFQDHEYLHAGGAMTLAAGGALEWAIARGDAGFTATADGPVTSGAVTDGDVADGETAFAGDIVIDGEAEVDLNDPVVSTNGDIDLSAADALTAERLRAETGAITVADTNAAYVDNGRAGATLTIDTAGDQGHGTLESLQAMTLSAGGDLDYTRLTGDATLDTDVAGTATGTEAVFDATITAAGSGDYDLGRVESTGADVVATVGGGFDVTTLRALNGLVDIDAGRSAIDDGESGETIDIVTDGAQDHGRLLATDALRFEAGIDHAGVESSWIGGPETGADFEAGELESLDDDIHVDAGYAAVEQGVAAADGAEIRIHTSGEQAHGQADPDANGQLRADGRVELTGGGTVTLREVIAGKESDDPATGGDAVIESINGDIVGNRIVASRDIILLALNGGLELDRLDYGGTYTLEAGRDIVAGFQDDFDSRDGELKAGRHIEITTTGGGDEPGDILLGGAEAEGGHFILDAAGDIRVAEATVGGQITSGGLVAGDFIDLTAGGEIYVENGVDAGTTIDATAEGGDLTVDGWLRSGGQQTLHAEAALTTPEITSGAGVEATAGNMDLGAVTAATDVGLDAVRDIVVFSVETGGDQSIAAGETLDFERLTAEGRIDSRSVGDTTGVSVTAARPVRMVAGLDGTDVEQASDLRLDRLEAPVATLRAGDELVVDTAWLRERGDLEARDGTLGIVHTGAGDLLLDATGPGDRVADRFDLDIDAPAPGAVVVDSLYAAFADIDTNAVEVDIRDAWIPRRLELDTARASLLADNEDPATRAYDFQLHEMDQRFRARVDGRRLFTTAYTIQFGMGYSVDVPNFIASHETKQTEIGGQSAERNGLRRLVPPPMPEAGRIDGGAPGELVIEESEPGRGPLNLDLTELGRRLQADQGDGIEDRTF